MPLHHDASRQKRRLLRQFAVIERRVPILRRPIRALLRDGWIVLRLPAALLMILGGLLSFLPFLGLWMLPLGLLLLAVDVPVLRPGASALAIRARRLTSERMRRMRSKRASR